jgi:hypothetical protein
MGQSYATGRNFGEFVQLRRDRHDLAEVENRAEVGPEEDQTSFRSTADFAAP